MSIDQRALIYQIQLDQKQELSTKLILSEFHPQSIIDFFEDINSDFTIVNNRLLYKNVEITGVIVGNYLVYFHRG